jgi:hypothetical protein
MNQARSRALARLRAEPAEGSARSAIRGRAPGAAHAALDSLAPEERQAIEAAFFSETDPCRSRAPAEPVRGDRQDANRPAGCTSFGGCWPKAGASLELALRLRARRRSSAHTLSRRFRRATRTRSKRISSPGAQCRRELESLRPGHRRLRLVGRSTCCVLRRRSRSVSPHRIALDSGEAPVLPGSTFGPSPNGKRSRPGISCKLLASDPDRHRREHAGPPRARRRIPAAHRMPASKSCICWKASSGSTSASSTPGDYTAPSPAPATGACGARRAARVC